MIDVKELRIGNYLQNNKGKIRIVSELNTNENEFNIKAWGINEDRCFGSTEDNLFPVELTEEWLTRMGFEGKVFIFKNEPSKEYFIHKNLFPEHYWIYLPYKTLSTYVGNIQIKYVHQLQNLYFALTNEELTIKN